MMTHPTWERLAVGDRIPLWVEEHSAAMNIAVAGTLDPAPLVDRSGEIPLAAVRAAVSARLQRVPSLRRRMYPRRWSWGGPVWSDDVDFSVDRHVYGFHLSGADMPAFLSWAARWAARHLDRRHPLWRIAFVSGLNTGDVGVVIVVHHAMADGMSGAALAAALLDHTPGEHPPVEEWHPAPPPSRRELRRAAVAVRAPRVPRAPAGRGAPRADLHQTLAALRARAPDIGLPRSIAGAYAAASVSWPLAQVRAVAHARAATINDLVLAVVAAGVRRLLVERDVSAAGLAVRVSVPVAGAPGSRNAGGTVPLVLTLPVGDADPARSLEAVAAQTRQAKAERDRAYPGMFAAPLMPGAVVRLAVRWMVRHSADLINLYVTNVRGPDGPLWFAGARLNAVHPLPPLVAGVPLAVGVLSYAGSLVVTVTAPEGVRPDAVVLGVREGFTLLESEQRATTP